jgi:hypothetical protein
MATNSLLRVFGIRRLDFSPRAPLAREVKLDALLQLVARHRHQQQPQVGGALNVEFSLP